jgi:hypothetical protein
MKGLNKLWSLIRNAITKCIRILSHKEYSISAESADSFDFPIPIAIIFIVGWIFICAALFCIWEKNWSYFDSFYFFFISLSTVGLGDLTPKHPKYMICMFPLVIAGLCFVSLVINLIQNKLEQLKEKTTGFLENQVGFDEDTESEGDDESRDKLDDNSNSPENNQRATLGVIQTLPKVNSSEKFDKNLKMTLGVVQTLQKARQKRRRFGVQTDESYIRDCRMKEKEKDKQIALNGQLPSLHQHLLETVSPEDDRISIGSLDTVFYDAQCE